MCWRFGCPPTVSSIARRDGNRVMMRPVEEEPTHFGSIERILGGIAENSNGALTIVALAQEAGAPHNALTRRHTDLKTEFSTRVREHRGTSEVEASRARQPTGSTRRSPTRTESSSNGASTCRHWSARSPCSRWKTSDFARPTSRTSRPSHRASTGIHPRTRDD